MENEDFLKPESKKCSEMIEKALPTEGFRDVFQKQQKAYKTNGKCSFWKCKKRVQNTL